jgi:hypothetical protein
MIEDELKLQMRLYAVEILSVNLLAISLLQTGTPLELLAEIRQQMIDGAKTHVFPGLDDPAISDLFSAELEAAVDRLMEMASGQINAVLQDRKQQTEGGQ